MYNDLHLSSLQSFWFPFSSHRIDPLRWLETSSYSATPVLPRSFLGPVSSVAPGLGTHSANAAPWTGHRGRVRGSELGPSGGAADAFAGCQCRSRPLEVLNIEVRNTEATHAGQRSVGGFFIRQTMSTEKLRVCRACMLMLETHFLESRHQVKCEVQSCSVAGR